MKGMYFQGNVMNCNLSNSIERGKFVISHHFVAYCLHSNEYKVKMKLKKWKNINWTNSGSLGTREMVGRDQYGCLVGAKIIV